jgi:hypothetical protein
MEIRKFKMLEDAFAAGFKIDLGNGEYGRADVIPKLKLWKCCGCGAPSPDRKRSCDCVTDCLYRDNEQATKIDPRTYDVKCFDLAEAFLEDSPHLATARRTQELAALIQTTIEDWLDHEQSNYEPPDPPGWEGGFADNH